LCGVIGVKNAIVETGCKPTHKKKFLQYPKAVNFKINQLDIEMILSAFVILPVPIVRSASGKMWKVT
jgi:hypothetical protein